MTTEIMADEFKIAYPLTYDEIYQRGRRDAIEKIKEVVKNRLIDNLGLKDATKYGNKNAIQQMNSYATVMKYEIAECVDDLIDDLEQMKGETENECMGKNK